MKLRKNWNRGRIIEDQICFCLHEFCKIIVVHVVVVTFVSTWDRRKIKEKVRRDVFKGIDIQQVLAMNMVLQGTIQTWANKKMRLIYSRIHIKRQNVKQ